MDNARKKNSWDPLTGTKAQIRFFEPHGFEILGRIDSPEDIDILLRSLKERLLTRQEMRGKTREKTTGPSYWNGNPRPGAPLLTGRSDRETPKSSRSSKDRKKTDRGDQEVA